MKFPIFIDHDLLTWVLLPLLIFFARILDVSLGTMRIIFLSRRQRHLAPIIGFFEVLIWIVVISQLVRNLSNFAGYIAYAAGFAAGNFVGIMIEEKLAMGTVIVRAFVTQEWEEIIECLTSNGYGVTSIYGQGAKGTVKVIYTIIRRKELNEVINLLHAINPKIFYTVEEIRTLNQGIFHPPKSEKKRMLFNLHKVRKGK